MDAAPCSWSMQAAVARVPPVEMMSSTITTSRPAASMVFGAIRTTSPESRVFTRWSQSHPLTAATSAAKSVAPSSGARTRGFFRRRSPMYPPMAGAMVTSLAGTPK